MFESAGFEVLDLGVDVPIQTFIDTVNEHKDATIVALSAASYYNHAVSARHSCSSSGAAFPSKN